MTIDESQFSHLLYRVENKVAHIVLNRPDKLNALGIGPGSSRDEIGRAVALANGNTGVGAILISANGRAFCAGGDLGRIEEHEDAPETALDHFQFMETVLKLYADIRASHVPVISAVHGYCLGAGLGLAAQTDLIVASDDAKFGLVEGRMGHPGATDVVPLVGAAWTKFLILTGEHISARRAEQIGLVLTVVPRDEMLDRATDLAERIARMPREAVLLNKASIESMAETSGRATGRVVGRLHDVITRSMSPHAHAPDGRLFEQILKQEGVEGMKRARDAQYSTNWLDW